MAKRHSDALFIQEGACNPSGIAISIVDACRAIRDEPTYKGTVSLTGDPAIRLMVHQLAFICGIISGVEEFADKKQINYGDCAQACREIEEADVREEVSGQNN